MQLDGEIDAKILRAYSDACPKNGIGKTILLHIDKIENRPKVEDFIRSKLDYTGTFNWHEMNACGEVFGWALTVFVPDTTT